MDETSINLPHVRGFDVGIGVSRLSGQAMNLVVQPDASLPQLAGGAIQSFEVTRITSTADLEKKLGLDVEASYGCAAFGAGASARFSFMQETAVHASSLFMAITATVKHADLSIDQVRLTDAAAAVVGDQGRFTARYGEMFCRAVTRGGIFVGVLRVDTRTESEATSVAADLKGSYGLFSAEASLKFSQVAERYNASVYCKVYAEGGPPVAVTDPNDPHALLALANAWITALVDDPETYARPYEWTLAPVTIAEGPWPDAATLQNAQDVLLFCARERVSLLDDLNDLDWIQDNPGNFSWANTSVTLEDVTRVWRARQADLDLVRQCASTALTDPSSARFPAAYAAALDPPAAYRGVPTPAPLPTGRPRPIPAGNQNGWRFCGKCSVMFYDGYVDNKGLCAGGGAHAAAGYDFWLAHAAYDGP